MKCGQPMRRNDDHLGALIEQRSALRPCSHRGGTGVRWPHRVDGAKCCPNQCPEANVASSDATWAKTGPTRMMCREGPACGMPRPPRWRWGQNSPVAHNLRQRSSTQALDLAELASKCVRPPSPGRFQAELGRFRLAEPAPTFWSHSSQCPRRRVGSMWGLFSGACAPSARIRGFGAVYFRPPYLGQTPMSTKNT